LENCFFCSLFARKCRNPSYAGFFWSFMKCIFWVFKSHANYSKIIPTIESGYAAINFMLENFVLTTQKWQTFKWHIKRSWRNLRRKRNLNLNGILMYTTHTRTHIHYAWASNPCLTKVGKLNKTHLSFHFEIILLLLK
jgi:hypothetical protein